MPAYASAYGWNETAARYIDRDTGRFVARAVVARELDAVVELSRARMSALSEGLLAGETTLAEWQSGMEREVKLVHVVGGAAARGGWAQMSPSDWGFVGAQVKRQYRFLDRFAAELATGQMPLDRRVLTRAGLYAQSGRGTYEEMGRRMARVRGKRYERRRVTSGEHCPDCLTYAARGWQPIGTLPRLGDSQCYTNCHCFFEYR
jgi:hypothetical protein